MLSAGCRRLWLVLPCHYWILDHRGMSEWRSSAEDEAHATDDGVVIDGNGRWGHRLPGYDRRPRDGDPPSGEVGGRDGDAHPGPLGLSTVVHDIPAARCRVCGRSAAELVRALARARPHVPRVLVYAEAMPPAAADLELEWLVPTGRSWSPARYCTYCAPSGDLWPVECTDCTAGPIVVLDTATLPLPGMPNSPRAWLRATAWLTRTGWIIGQHGNAIYCPSCRAR